MNILFVEDDAIIASGLVYALQAEGYEVTHCADVQSAQLAIEQETFSLALLDLSLPDGTGFDVCEMLKGKPTAIIFLTAVDDEGNTVKALEMGADDYITKPFRIRELMARIKAALRRQNGGEHGREEGTITMGNLCIHTTQAKVTKEGEEILLTALEYKLLLTFARNQGQVLTRAQILESLWDVAGNFVNDNTLTVYIKRLREKLEDDPQNPALIHTVRAMGYKGGN